MSENASLCPIKKKKIDSFDLAYDDGKWHHVGLTLTKDKINFTIDTEVLVRVLLSQIKLSNHFLIGGGHSDMKGFIGCLRNIVILESVVSLNSKGTVNISSSFFCWKKISNPDCH